MPTWVHHLLGGFDWNLTEPTWFTLLVHEVHPDRILRYRFPGPEGFARHYDGEEPRTSPVIWSCRYLDVEAALMDHKLPVLAYRVVERPMFAVDSARMAAAGLAAGDWLNDLKTAVWKDKRDHPVHPLVVGPEGGEAVACPDPAALYASIRADAPCASLGYVTDIGRTDANRAVLERVFAGLTLLCMECTFLAADLEKARASYHLCTTDLNDLMDRLRPAWLLAMHLSKSYLRRTVDLYAELAPPEGTGILRLPGHLVPAPLTVEEVEHWMVPGESCSSAGRWRLLPKPDRDA